jgi:ubiquinone/menaquinone biosynthesis C-methylase UbiE
MTAAKTMEVFLNQRLKTMNGLLGPVSSVLDVGCGEGVSSCFAEDSYGLDVRGSSYSRRRERFVLADAQYLPFEANSFDLVYCWELLHHISWPARAIEEMARVSRRLVLVVEPNPSNLAMFAYACISKDNRGILDYSMRGLVRFMQQAQLDLCFAGLGGWVTPSMPSWLATLVARLPYCSGSMHLWVLGAKR